MTETIDIRAMYKLQTVMKAHFSEPICYIQSDPRNRTLKIRYINRYRCPPSQRPLFPLRD